MERGKIVVVEGQEVLLLTEFRKQPGIPWERAWCDNKGYLDVVSRDADGTYLGGNWEVDYSVKWIIRKAYEFRLKHHYQENW